MDETRFDQLTREWLGQGSRRSLLLLLASLPFGAVLATLFATERGDAKKRKQRDVSSENHKHKGRRRKHKPHRRRKQKQRCKPESVAQTCADTCGTATNNCDKTVDCGSCACEPLCGVCFTCQDGPNTPGTCVVDPNQQGDACGDPGQRCHPDGSCACTSESCANPTPLCVDSTCHACGGDAECSAAGAGDICCAGSCFAGNCCDGGDCTEPQAPICGEDHTCVACAANGECGADSLCLANGSCQPCNVICDGSPANCGTTLQAALAATPADGTLYLCPGRYAGNFALSASITLVGAGQGDDPAIDTILDAQGGGRVLQVNGATTTLQRLRITGGSLVSATGAGIRFQGTNLTLVDCTVTGNHVTGATGSSGGGISQPAAGTLRLTGCTVSDNSAVIGGGIALTAFSTVRSTTITGSTISGNHSNTQGGGIVNGFGTLTLEDTAVTGNTAGSDGGGIANLARGKVNLFNGSTISDNTANLLGGGIFNANAPTCTITVADSEVTGNRANGEPGSGGGIRNEQTVVFTSGSISGNTPDDCVNAGAGTGCPGA